MQPPRTSAHSTVQQDNERVKRCAAWQKSSSEEENALLPSVSQLPTPQTVSQCNDMKAPDENDVCGADSAHSNIGDHGEEVEKDETIECEQDFSVIRLGVDDDYLLLESAVTCRPSDGFSLPRMSLRASSGYKSTQQQPSLEMTQHSSRAHKGEASLPQIIDNAANKGSRAGKLAAAARHRQKLVKQYVKRRMSRFAHQIEQRLLEEQKKMRREASRIAKGKRLQGARDGAELCDVSSDESSADDETGKRSAWVADGHEACERPLAAAATLIHSMTGCDVRQLLHMPRQPKPKNQLNTSVAGIQHARCHTTLNGTGDKTLLAQYIYDGHAEASLSFNKSGEQHSNPLPLVPSPPLPSHRYESRRCAARKRRYEFHKTRHERHLAHA